VSVPFVTARGKLSVGGRNRDATSPELPPAILLDPSDNGLVVASSLCRHGVDVVVLATPFYAWVARTRAARGDVLPRIRADPRRWLNRLEQLAEQLGGGVLIPASDAACEFLVTERDQIPSVLRSFEAADTPHLQLMDKDWLYQLAERLRIRYPASWRVSSRADLDRVLDVVSYPCLLKPTVSHRWRELFGDVRILVLRTGTDLVRCARPALDEGLRLLITEYVPGPERNIEAIVTVRRADGTFALEYGRRKIRQQPPWFGAGTMQESIDPSGLRDLARQLLDAAGFVGVSSIEVKRHAEDGEPVLIEVNVRIPQSWGIGDASRTDASWRLYATLAGIPLPPQPQQSLGVRSIVPTLEVHAITRAVLEEKGSLRTFVGTYRGVRDLSGLSFHDPAPALAFVWGILVRAARRLVAGMRAVPAVPYPRPPAPPCASCDVGTTRPIDSFRPPDHTSSRAPSPGSEQENRAMTDAP
jgi:D-aspartate ligase